MHNDFFNIVCNLYRRYEYVKRWQNDIKYVLFNIFFLLFNSVSLNPNKRAHQFLHSKTTEFSYTPRSLIVQKCIRCHNMNIIQYNINMKYVVCTTIYTHFVHILVYTDQEYSKVFASKMT